MQQVA
jgi:WD40 repeat protein